VTRIVITGMGCISGLGRDLSQGWAALAAGQGAIRIWDEAEGGDGFPASRVDRQWVGDALAGRDLRHLGKLDPLSGFALTATIEAVTQAGLWDAPVLGEDTAILLGCGSGGNATIDAAFERLYGKGTARVHPQTIPSSMISAPASHVAMLLGAHGPAFVLASACASSAHAIGEAMHMIRGGRVKVAIAGGAEACLSRGSRVAWASLGVLAPDTCRPFSLGRKGIVLGEGAAMLVLEDAEHAAARGAAVLGELVGYGASSDAAHITAPDPAGIARAVRNAHRDAGIALDVPALISSHGTGTTLNDAAEATVLRVVYGDALARHRVIATKSAHGHPIGAGGAIEFVLGMKVLAEGIAPPVLGQLDPDPECDLPLVLEPEPISHQVLVSNSFAFGGLNAVLIGTTLQ
jgi:nodulation protein E